jgi:hypothetical protein
MVVELELRVQREAAADNDCAADIGGDEKVFCV